MEDGSGGWSVHLAARILEVGLGSEAEWSHCLVCNIQSSSFQLQLPSALCPLLSLIFLSPDSLTYALQKLSWLLLCRLWGDSWWPHGVVLLKYRLPANSHFQSHTSLHLLLCVQHLRLLRSCSTKGFFLIWNPLWVLWFQLPSFFGDNSHSPTAL